MPDSNGTDGQPPAAPASDVQAPGGSSNGAGNGHSPGLPASSAAAAFLRGVETWCGYEFQTVDEFLSHLAEMEAALRRATSLFEGVAARIVGLKIHPAVAQPIINFSTDFAALRLHMTEAHLRFMRFYETRLAYEQAMAEAVKPADSFFKQ